MKYVDLSKAAFPNLHAEVPSGCGFSFAAQEVACALKAASTPKVVKQRAVAARLQDGHEEAMDSTRKIDAYCKWK